jgi:hypothetical protein
MVADPPLLVGTVISIGVSKQSEITRPITESVLVEVIVVYFLK